MVIPLWAYGAGGAALLAIGIAGGWTVRGWKADADTAKIERKLEEEAARQRARADAAASGFEINRDAVDRQNYATNTVIRETFREIPVPAECAAPEPVADSLRAATRATNAAVTGSDPSALPANP
jgi:hypothetical protein